jgi:hypothetical protein
VTQIIRGGQLGAADHIETTQGEFRQQLAALTDALRQVAGNAAIVPGAAGQADPLSAPFTLYVNPYTGSDKFVGGSYNTFEGGETDEEIIASKLKRIEMQRLECGFTPQRPFKTINRAVIEAAIITSKSWYTYTDPRAHVDCVSIVLAPGVHTLYNDPGRSNPALTSWGNEKDPTIAELTAFNPRTVGGVVLPRGCSLCGPDLRKTTIRPTWVPAAADERPDYSNRRGMLKITGTGYFFGFTVMDKVGHKASHHLLDTFHFASKAELDEFYAKCFSAVGGGANLGEALTVTRPTEHQIVGPIEGAPSEAWDTTASASPYIFNCSIRSDYGIGGAFMDGSKVSGLKSMVTAQFTGVSLQKDMSCWQRYVDGEWVPTTYAQYIATEPNNIRMHPLRMSRHISAVNDAFIQEVSVFAIGQGIHHFTDRGGEITVTNSNSSFGGCAALSTGYKTAAFPQDKNWTLNRIRVPLNAGEKKGNVRRVFLGTISAVSASTITLVNPLAVDETSSSVPAILLKDGYSLPAGTKIWVENPTGAHWRSDLAAAAWDASKPGEVKITKALLQAGTNEPVGTNPETNQSLAIGKRVYVRRLVDTRSPSERRASLQLNNTASARLPERSFIVQTDPARAGGAISSELAPGGSQVLIVTGTGIGPNPAGPGVAKTAEVTIRRGATSVNYARGTYYRAGTTVKHRGKHYQSLKDQLAESDNPSPLTWGENFVHMPSGYNAEDVSRNEAPFLVFDTDTDDADNTETCGINFSTIWTRAGSIRDQYRSGTDYRGVHGFLVAMGLASDQAHQALLPRAAGRRELNPASADDFPTAPSGGAADGRGNWALEFRRPSVLRLYGHAWEWAGYLNYSKSIPAAQKDLSPQNKFTYYFTNDRGGRVVPQGSNEDGFNVTPRGLEDVETGATLTVDSIGNSTLDDFQSTDFPNGLTASEITVGNLTITTSVEFPDVAAAKVNKLGPVRLASITEVTATGASAPVSTDNGQIEASPSVVTIGALNRWRQANRLVSAGTGSVVIFVKAGAPDRNLASMLDNPPNSAQAAIPTLARASEYANEVIGGGNQTAVIRMAPGLYDPASIWDCNVQFEAYNAALTARRFASNSLGSATTPNNYFDGSGHADFAQAVNFWAFRLTLRDRNSAGNNLHINCAGRQMRFLRGFNFIGGFHFLGLAETIKAVAQGLLPASSFVAGSGTLPASAFTTNTSNNLDVLLNAIRTTNSRNPSFGSFTGSPVISVEGGKRDQSIISDCVFGPGIPSRKELLGGLRYAYIETNGDSPITVRNIYIRGASVITSGGMGVTSELPSADKGHYGSTAVAAPWTWRQSYHTFIGSHSGAVSIEQLGGVFAVLTVASDSLSRSYYQDLTGKLLPNHIQLLTTDGVAPGNNSSGPFFDQFIHAHSSLRVNAAWSEVAAQRSTGPSLQGFVGKMGANGHNAVKTRAALLGNGVQLGRERGFDVFLSGAVQGGQTQGYTVVQRAGETYNNQRSARPEMFGSGSFGEPSPLGYNPVITDADGGKATVGLNFGVRSWRTGISPEYAGRISNNTVA